MLVNKFLHKLKMHKFLGAPGLRGLLPSVRYQYMENSHACWPLKFTKVYQTMDSLKSSFFQAGVQEQCRHIYIVKVAYTYGHNSVAFNQNWMTLVSIHLFDGA